MMRNLRVITDSLLGGIRHLRVLALRCIDVAEMQEGESLCILLGLLGWQYAQ